MNWKSEDIKNYCIAICYAVFVLFLVVFTISYAFTDWDEVAENFAESTKEIAESIQCEIDYGGFHFKGFCSDKEIVLEYMQNLTRCD